jgi:cytochrome c oxidase subunit 2
MGLVVIADPPEQYERWVAAQRQPATPPTDPLARRGYDLFTQRSCAACHNVTGAPAFGRTGPDLTHLASRSTIAAGFLANTPENRAAWIRDPQRFKPGNRMPAHDFPDDELDALGAYLATLR